jgi:hypothetical protein
MKISSLIARLTAVQTAHGEVDVILRDPDTDWLLDIAMDADLTEASADGTIPTHVVITSYYDATYKWPHKETTK